MTGTAPSGRGGWFKIILGVSLAANVFFIGLMGGSLFSGGKEERRDDPPNSFIESLSEERAAEVKAYFATLREDRKASRQNRRAVWADVRTAMTADPYDREALETAMKAVMDERTKRSTIRYGKMVDFVSGLTVEERAAFSEAMRQRWQRRRAKRERESN